MTPERIINGLRFRIVERYIKLQNRLNRNGYSNQQTNDRLLRDIISLTVPSDISDHLPVLYAEALRTGPKLIVELGVRGGSSTFALESAASITNAKLLSVDIDECSSVSKYNNWEFVQADDIDFSSRFEEWCGKRSITPSIDLLFIDTSHLYEHSVKEIKSWFPFLSAKGTAIFHDTNMKEVYHRLDGSRGHGWKNNRGVIKAIEEFLGTSLDESKNFTSVEKGWIIRHHANCSGLTILEKISN